MIKTIVVCDCCGKEIKDDVVLVQKFKGHVNGEMSELLEEHHYHEGCLHIGSAKPAPPPVWAEPVPDKKKKKIDTGKCLALKNAGWTSKEIAEEMGLTLMQVQGALQRERAKEKADADNNTSDDTCSPSPCD